jgi:hypothetical protein
MRPSWPGRASRAGSRRAIISFLFSFLLHLLSHLTLKLMKPLDLIRRENAAHLGADTGIKSYLVSLSFGQRFRCSADFCSAIGLAHYRAIERLSRLPQPAPCCQGFVLVIPPNLLHSRPLFGRQPDRLHQSLLQLLFLYLIRIKRPVSTRLRDAKRRPLNAGQAIPANLATGLKECQTRGTDLCGCKVGRDSDCCNRH